ncbi:hypothetical protein O181_109153 [Austropuccinia psidii MF-1]|uniref:Uncharacterized protein n=1 Tax=Austropuccinia psidii MF-1 TaxID=1389203 RepID=A0A9Q3JU73_9BASI|nr:hypothetical protein [Austropuccinia psidii MF-1]
MTELTESAPSVLCGSSILSQLASPSMASSGNFNPSQTYDGYKAVEILDPAYTECLAKEAMPSNWETNSNLRRYLWSKKYGHFGKEFPVSKAPTPDATSGYSALTGSRQRDVARWTNVWGPIYSSSKVPISRINNEGVVKQIRRIANSPPKPDAEGSDELDGEEVEVVPISAGHPVNSSSSHPPAKRLQSHIIHNTPRNFQPTLATNPTSIPLASPNPSHTRPALNQAPQPVASTSRRREELSPLPFPDAQVFQHRDQWPIRITREDPNMENENKDAVARLFRRVERNSREVIMYANDRTLPGTASEKRAAKFCWYEDELINDFQKTFDHLGRDN